MGKMKMNSTDAQWLHRYYPELHIENDDTIIGILHFRAERKGRCKRRATRHPELEIWHSPTSETKGRPYIEDSYEIEGFFDEDLKPHFTETGGRLKAYAEKIGKPMIDLHVYPGKNEFCLGHPVIILAQMKKDASIKKFFEGFLIPYMYYLSYRQKFNQEPWPGLKHGEIGFFEELGSLGSKHKISGQDLIEATWRHLSQATQHEICLRVRSGLAMKRNDKCFCGSGKKVKDCCGDLVMKGFNNFLKAVRASRN